LLFALVPEGSHDEESGLTDGLKYTEQSSDGNERRKAKAEGVAAKYGTPCENVGSEVFGDWYALDDVVRGVFDHEHGEVDAGGEPSELSQVS
jgi:hypothetical protein